MKRRTFISQTGLAAAGALMSAHSYAGSFNGLPAPGLQLFTFFSSIDNDVKSTMEKIAAVGYKNIESAFSRKGGYYGMAGKEFSTLLRDLGMSWRSHHVIGAPFKMPAGAKMPTDADGNPIKIPVMKNLRDNHQEMVDDAAAAGVEYLVCASIPITSAAEVKEAVVVLNKTALSAKKAGIKFVYHNHDAEFREVDGVVPYDVFLKDTEIKMELDLAWAVKGGKDPVQLFQKYPGRFPLWHVKDLDESRQNVLPVGKGTINFKPIFEAAGKAGLQYYFIEHDMPKDALASIKESMAAIKKM